MASSVLPARGVPRVFNPEPVTFVVLPAWDMDSLKRAIQTAQQGVGAVRRIIETCTFLPREPAFTKLIVMCGRFGMWQKAVEVYETMRSGVCAARGLRPNAFTYSALISACNNAGQFSRALGYFMEVKEVAELDPKCTPTLVTYGSVICACEGAGKYTTALEIFDEMVGKGVQPDNITLMSVFDICVKSETWSRAGEILEELHERGCSATGKSYAGYLEGYCAARGHWARAVEVFVRMQKVGQKPDALLCRGLVIALESGGKVDFGIQLLREMIAKGIPVHPDTHAALLRMGVQHGQGTQMVDLLNLFAKSHAKLDDAMVMEVIRSSAACAAQTAGVSPSIAWNAALLVRRTKKLRNGRIITDAQRI